MNREDWQDHLRDEIEICEGPVECNSDLHGHCANSDCGNVNQEFDAMAWHSPYCSDCNAQPRPDAALTARDVAMSMANVQRMAAESEDPEKIANAKRWADQVRRNTSSILFS